MAVLARNVLWSCTLLATGFGALPANADDAPQPPPAATTPSSPSGEAKADPYAVPDGTPEQITDFLDDLRRSRKVFASREDAVDHAIKVQRALIAGADKILAQKTDEDTAYAAAEMKLQALGLLASAGIDGAMAEALKAARSLQKDEREDIAELAGEWVTELRVVGAPELEPAERTALVNEFLDAVKKTKYSRQSLSNAIRLGESLETNPDASIAAEYYADLSALMKSSLNSQYVEIAEYLDATVRRLRLPGNSMVVTGTTLAGQPFDWKTYKGKVVLVDFWATWCEACVAELPNIKANYDKYHAQGFDVVGISVDEDKDQLAAFLKSQQIPWTNLFAEGGEQPTASYYGISPLPTAILVGRDGKVLSLMARGEILNELLEKEFAKAPPASKPEPKK
uniref:TlpA family protein disulfide reductase n=1 Tax=Schlesneria paludicola TaxID=360056 RepID=A0A7C2P261_9PLAN